MAHLTTLSRLVAGVALLAVSSGCSVAVTAGTPTSSASSSAEPAASAASPAVTATDATEVPAGAVSVDTLVTAATRTADRTSTAVLGDSSGATYDNALSLWAGCDGAVDQVTFGVAGHTVMQGRLALRPSVPKDIIIEVLVSVDGSPVQNVQLDATDPRPAFVGLRFLLRGATTVTTQTKVVKGTCADATESYAVLVDGYVS